MKIKKQIYDSPCVDLLSERTPLNLLLDLSLDGNVEDFGPEEEGF